MSEGERTPNPPTAEVPADYARRLVEAMRVPAIDGNQASAQVHTETDAEASPEGA